MFGHLPGWAGGLGAGRVTPSGSFSTASFRLQKGRFPRDSHSILVGPVAHRCVCPCRSAGKPRATLNSKCGCFPCVRPIQDGLMNVYFVFVCVTVCCVLRVSRVEFLHVGRVYAEKW